MQRVDQIGDPVDAFRHLSREELTLAPETTRLVAASTITGVEPSSTKTCEPPEARRCLEARRHDLRKIATSGSVDHNLSEEAIRRGIGRAQSNASRIEEDRLDRAAPRASARLSAKRPIGTAAPTRHGVASNRTAPFPPSTQPWQTPQAMAMPTRGRDRDRALKGSGTSTPATFL